MRTTVPRLLAAGVMAAGVMAAALGSDQPALATALGSDQPARAAAPAVGVPCHTTALAAALTSATDGETLQLAATCRYVLTTALPDITVNLTITGRGATLERSDAAGTPDFSLLTVTAGSLSVSHLTFRNGTRRRHQRGE